MLTTNASKAAIQIISKFKTEKEWSRLRAGIKRSNVYILKYIYKVNRVKFLESDSLGG